jgi:hypothetical protein
MLEFQINMNFKLQELLQIFTPVKYAMKRCYRRTREYEGLPTLQFLTSYLKKKIVRTAHCSIMDIVHFFFSASLIEKSCKVSNVMHTIM